MTIADVLMSPHIYQMCLEILQMFSENENSKVFLFNNKDKDFLWQTGIDVSLYKQWDNAFPQYIDHLVKPDFYYSELADVLYLKKFNVITDIIHENEVILEYLKNSDKAPTRYKHSPIFPKSLFLVVIARKQLERYIEQMQQDHNVIDLLQDTPSLKIFESKNDGYIQLSTEAKPIKIGSVNSRPFKLLTILANSINHDWSIDAILEKILSSEKYIELNSSKKITTLANIRKELQRGNKFRHLFEIIIDKHKRRIKLVPLQFLH